MPWDTSMMPPPSGCPDVVEARAFIVGSGQSAIGVGSLLNSVDHQEESEHQKCGRNQGMDEED